jgi:curved DNA-binding protein CbpA
MSDEKLDQLDYYTLLGVSREASDTDIRRAFRTFAKKYHPDRFPAHETEKRARATQIYRRGAEGFQVLTDEAARRLYDKALAQGIRRLTAEQRDSASRPRKPKPSEPTIQSTEARRWFERARAAAEGRDFQAAWRSLEKAIGLEPENELIRAERRRIEAILRRGGI